MSVIKNGETFKNLGQPETGEGAGPPGPITAPAYMATESLGFEPG